MVRDKYREGGMLAREECSLHMYLLIAGGAEIAFPRTSLQLFLRFAPHA